MMNAVQRRLLIAGTVVVVLAGVIVGPRVIAGLTKKTTPPQLATASYRSFPVVATTTGNVVPSSQIALNFSQTGQLTQISVSTGQKVVAGQVIARIGDSAEQADLQAANASLQVARAELVVAQHPSSGRAPDPTQIQVAQAQIAAATAQVARAQAALAETVLTAPAAGTVLAINAQVGELVGPAVSSSIGTVPNANPGTSGTAAKAFAVIGDATTLQVSAPFAEADASHLAPGQKGVFTVDAVSGLSVPCHLISLATDPTVVNGVVEYVATVGLDATDPRLRNGMTVNLTLNTARADNVLSVPNQALYELDGSLHVDVWYQNRAVSTQVGTGLVGTELTQITSGLSDGQQVLLSAPHGLPAPSPTG